MQIARLNKINDRYTDLNHSATGEQSVPYQVLRGRQDTDNEKTQRISSQPAIK